MNFIAHIQLSEHQPRLLVGNYIADLIRQKDLETLSDEILKGVRLHRFIDAFTDTHAVNKKSRSLLYARHHKYATVLLDIYYDYFLIRHWESFDKKSFDYTCRETYAILFSHMDEIPVTARANIENLLNKRWLEDAYGTIEGLDRTFYFLKKRTSRPEWVNGGVETLLLYEKELEQAFLSFYPHLVTATRAFLKDGVVN